MQYRYRLGRQTGRCPQCRRQTFKYYIDSLDGRRVGDEYGRCNREVKCGYHCRPSGNRPLRADEGTPSLRFDGDGPVSTLPAEMYERLPLVDARNDLYAYLSRHYDPTGLKDAFRIYGISHAKFAGGSTAFWLIDRMGNIRSAKVMAYDRATGKRVKDRPYAAVSYAHSLLHLPDYNYRACYFGESVACDRLHGDATVIIVESEKTALLVNLELMRRHLSLMYVCVATGGASSLRADPTMLGDPYYRASFLKGRRVLLIPDADMVDEWRRSAETLRGHASDVGIIDVTKAPYMLGGSDDIGDYILNFSS